MKKTKTEQKSENEYYSFFENELSNKPFTLAVAGNSELTQTVSAAARFESQTDKYFGYFKKIFSFVPGVLFLHFAVPATIEFGLGIWGVFFFLAGSLMVWAGIERSEKQKSLAAAFIGDTDRFAVCSADCLPVVK